MPRKRRTYSSSHIRRTSDQVRSSMVGAHVPREGGGRGKRMNADQVGFSSSRRAKRAARGTLDTFVPNTSTRESAHAYARRTGRTEFTQAVQRKSRAKRVFAVIACILIAIAVAVGVGLAVYFTSVSARLSLGDSNAREALVAPAADQTSFYALLTAELGAAQGSVDEDGADAYILAHVDQQARSVALIWLPANLEVSYGDGEYGRLRDAAAVDDATLVKAVSLFAGIDIAHFAETDVDGIGRLVDRFGGVTVDLAEEVDDPRAGTVYIPAGQQTIGSDEIPTLLRATNYTDGTSGQARVQCQVLAAILEKLAGGEGPLADAALLDDVSGDVATDVDSQQALDFAQALSGMTAAEVEFYQVPGGEVQRDGVTVFQAYSEDWTALMGSIDAGQQIQSEGAGADDGADGGSADGTATAGGAVDPGSFTITVRNGAGITGAASQMSDQLAADGFNVAEVGNTDSPVYDETLIIYKDEAFEPAAQSVAAALTEGRVINGGDYYTFETDVLVVLGSDWKPLA